MIADRLAKKLAEQLPRNLPRTCRPCRLRPDRGAESAGLGRDAVHTPENRPDRRFPVGLFRHRRPGECRSHQDGDRGIRRHHVRQADRADHGRRCRTRPTSRVRSGAQMVRERGRRHDHRHADLGDRAGRDGDVEAVREDHDRHGRGELGHHRQVLLALYRALDLRHLRQRAYRRQRHRQERRHDLVLHHRRLPVRPFDRARHRRRRPRRRRHRGRQRPASAEHRRLLVRSCCRRNRRRPRSSASPMAARTPSTPSSRPRSSASWPAARTSPAS